MWRGNEVVVTAVYVVRQTKNAETAVGFQRSSADNGAFVRDEKYNNNNNGDSIHVDNNILVVSGTWCIGKYFVLDTYPAALIGIHSP